MPPSVLSLVRGIAAPPFPRAVSSQRRGITRQSVSTLSLLLCGVLLQIEASNVPEPNEAGLNLPATARRVLLHDDPK